jgi:hypothetical protein
MGLRLKNLLKNEDGMKMLFEGIFDLEKTTKNQKTGRKRRRRTPNVGGSTFHWPSP